MATLPFPPRYSRNSNTFQIPGMPYDDRQGAAADAYNDILRQRVNADVASGRTQDPFYREGNPLVVEARANAPERGLSPGFAKDELLKRSDTGEFAAPGYGDLGQFAGGSGSIGSLGGGMSGKPDFDESGNSVTAFANGGDVQMPEQGANPFADPNTMAVYDQMRQTMSPKEFGDEMLAGASQVDPAAMAQFRKDLSEIDLSPEELDMLNNMVDEILATPEQYAAVRAKYLEMGAPEELLPEEFDPQFFAAMNMAVDQLIAEPAGVQAFAMGGIAELKPIAKAIAGYGRNGDTMLAHITPAEARMLRRRGGSGTINPATGLPEFFLKKMFKSLGKAIKSFASSTVGKIVTTVALGFFLGPAAAGLVGATSAAGVAAVGGFVGGAGSTLLAGGNLKDALKAGAIGGLTAGAVTGVSQGFGTAYTGPTTVGGQVDRFTGMLKTPPFPQYTAQGALTDTATSNAAREAYAGELYKTNPEAFYNPNAATPDALADFTAKKSSLIVNPQTGNLEPPPGFKVGQTTLPGGQILTQNVPIETPYDPATATRAVDFGYKPGGETSFIDKAKNFYNENISPSNIQAQGVPEAERAGAAARDAMLARTPSATPAMLDAEYLRASKAAMPGIFSTYAPITALGLGAVGLAGGFKATDATPSAMRDELMKPVTQRIAEGGNQRNYYMQGLPGVKYDQYGAPIFGQYNPLPTFDTGLGIQSLINPRGFSAGGAADKVFTINNFDETAYLNAHPDVKAAIAKGDFANAYEHYTKFGKAEGRTAFDKAETDAKAATDRAATEAAQAANRKVVADAKAAKKAAGFGDAYKNINAGLSYDTAAGYAAPSIAARQAAFAPKLGGLQNSMMGNSLTLSTPETQAYLSQNPDVMQAFKASNSGMSPDQFAQAHYQSSGKAEGRTMPVRAPVTQPYNNATGYGNVIKPVTTSVNYDTTPVGTTKPPITGGLGSMIGPVLKNALAAREGLTNTSPNTTITAGSGRTFIPDARLPEGMMGTMGGTGYDPVTGRVDLGTAGGSGQYVPRAQEPQEFMNMGGIATLGSGGYPRRTGQINGPGTATSDSIPAMLSDGEFVMTAKAVRGAGKGNRRAGAKRMYALMNQLEKNAARG